MDIIRQDFVGERSLFKSEGLSISECVFHDGESPLKESKNIKLKDALFRWKYPLWYCENVDVNECTFFEMARAGIWYTRNISIKNCMIEAPKSLRRSSGIYLENAMFSNAAETLWSCSDVKMKNVSARGDYLAMNAANVEVDGLQLVGNYAFDGAKNVVIKNSRLLTKDAFWNCENVTVENSFISGEYFGWNSKNVTLINCTVESLQGFCYMDNVVLKNCKLINTTLAFEYSTVDAEVKGKIDSVINPAGGRIEADEIGTLILDDDEIDKNKTEYILKNN